MIKAVLFDLDGTLLPMDQERFVKDYLGRLAAYLAPSGYEPSKLVDAVWKGVGAMVMNDGSCRNEVRFWQAFAAVFGEQCEKDRPMIEEFYRTEFQKVQKSCGFAPRSGKLIHRLQAAGYRLILATNPIFPAAATQSRIRWAGLQPSDFEFYTSYENINSCKPNLDYYREILKRQELDAGECLMAGNDVGEDMVAEQLGMKVFLVTDCLIDRGQDISRYPHGSLDDLADFLGVSEER